MEIQPMRFKGQITQIKGCVYGFLLSGLFTGLGISTHAQNNLSINGGVTFPVSDYSNDDFELTGNNSGFAKTGSHYSLDYARKIADQFGGKLRLGYGSNQIETEKVKKALREDLTNYYSTSLPNNIAFSVEPARYHLLNILIGPQLRKASPPFKFDLSANMGYMLVYHPGFEIDGQLNEPDSISQNIELNQESGFSGGFAFNLNAGAHYQLSKYFLVGIIADYYSAKPTFKNISTNLTVPPNNFISERTFNSDFDLNVAFFSIKLSAEINLSEL